MRRGVWLWVAGWTVVVDRIEGDMAVLEFAEGDWIPVSVAHLPRNIEEGDRIRLRGVRCRRNVRRGVRPSLHAVGANPVPMDL